jgi:hypothetical protein
MNQSLDPKPGSAWSRTLIATAALAGIVASVGDYLMLSMVVARSQGDTTFHPPMLVWAHYLGVFAIPWYMAGYWSLASALGIARGWARGLFLTGSYAAGLGGVIHGVSGVLIETGGPGPADSFSPADVPHAIYVVPLWIAVGLLFAAASACYAVAVRRTRDPLPRWAAWLNPLTLSVAIVLAAAPFPRLAPWIGAMSANLVHAMFFGGVAAVLWNARARPPARPV